MSWFEVPAGAPFGTEELPYGIFSTADSPRRVGVAVGDRVLDLAAVAEAAGLEADVFRAAQPQPADESRTRSPGPRVAGCCRRCSTTTSRAGTWSSRTCIHSTR